MSRLGVRVVRGPDWKWGDQDDGLGHVGTVVEFGRVGSATSPDSTVLVQWDSGNRTNYRIGFQKAFDLRVLDSGPSGVVHPNHSCSCCKTRIFGLRWSCSLCPETDLCSVCYNSERHEPQHPFTRIDAPGCLPVSVPSRKKSHRVHLRGIFKGALVSRGHDWDWGSQDGGEESIGTVLDVAGWDEESGRSVVSVKWNSTHSSNIYRVGHKGKVDLQYIRGREAFNGFYYPDHLPILRDEKVPAPPRSKENKIGAAYRGLSVGDCVQIKVDLESFKSLQSGFGGYSPRMSELAGQTGTVHRFTDKGAVRVQYPGRPAENHRWTINPKALAKVTTAFSPGSMVRILNDCDKVRRLQEGNWFEDMRGLMGKLGKVVSVNGSSSSSSQSVCVSINGRTWAFHPSCLSSVSRVDLDNREEDREKPQSSISGSVLGSSISPQPSSYELLSFAYNGQLSRLKEELKKASDIKSIIAALITGAERGHLDILKYLVNQYPDEVDLKVDGSTALHAAILQGHITIVETLLASGANIATTDDNGDCGIHYAVRGGNQELLESLCGKSGPSVLNTANKKGCTALHLAVLNQNYEAVATLLRFPLEVNAQDVYRDTPLHEAILQTNSAIIQSLVNHPRTDFRIKNSKGFNALQFAALKGNVFALKSILDKARQLAEVKKTDGFSPLHLAALNGHYSVAKVLLQQGKCSVSIMDNRGQSPVHLAAGQGHASIVELLISHIIILKDDPKFLSSILESQDSQGQTPLHLALDREGNPEPPDPSLSPRMAALHQKVITAGVNPQLQRSTTIAVFLIQNGASLCRKNLSGFTPLDFVSDPLAKSLLLLHHQTCFSGNEESSSTSSSSSAVSSSSNNQAECIICAEPSSSLITVHPCGHSSVCAECWTIRIKKCLKCKAPISHKTGGGGAPNKKKEVALRHVRDLEARVRDFEDQFQCTICMERKKNVAFQCGHAACAACVETLRSCHMCRGSVDKRINLY